MLTISTLCLVLAWLVFAKLKIIKLGLPDKHQGSGPRRSRADCQLDRDALGSERASAESSGQPRGSF